MDLHFKFFCKYLVQRLVICRLYEVTLVDLRLFGNQNSTEKMLSKETTSNSLGDSSSLPLRDQIIYFISSYPYSKFSIASFIVNTFGITISIRSHETTAGSLSNRKQFPMIGWKNQLKNALRLWHRQIPNTG